MIIFQASYASITNSCLDGNMHSYNMTQEKKNMVFRLNSEKIKQVTSKQLTLILDLSFKKNHFLEKYDTFFS